MALGQAFPSRRVAWWVRWYLVGVVITARLTGAMQDMTKVQRWIRRALPILASRNRRAPQHRGRAPRLARSIVATCGASERAPRGIGSGGGRWSGGMQGGRKSRSARHWKPPVPSCTENFPFSENC